MLNDDWCLNQFALMMPPNKKVGCRFPDMTTRETFHGLEEGNRVLFNDRKQPLTVDRVEEGRIFITGPKGGEYMLFLADDEETVLVAAPGQREYASAVTGLRIVGEWKKTGEDAWRHTGTGATIQVVTTPAGFWTLDTDEFAGEVDVPRYGFTEKEIAVAEAQKLMAQHPEG